MDFRGWRRIGGCGALVSLFGGCTERAVGDWDFAYLSIASAGHSFGGGITIDADLGVEGRLRMEYAGTDVIASEISVRGTMAALEEPGMYQGDLTIIYEKEEVNGEEVESESAGQQQVPGDWLCEALENSLSCEESPGGDVHIVFGFERSGVE